MALFEQIKENHQAFLKTLKDHSLDEKRKAALELFTQMGFPTKKVEEYKYTSFRKIEKLDYNFFPKAEHQLTADDIDKLHLGEENFDYIVFINGVLHKELSHVSFENIEYFSFDSIRENPEQKAVFDQYFNTTTIHDNPFAALNLAYWKFGFFMHVPKNMNFEKPIHIFYLSQNQDEDTFYNTRNLLVVEPNSKIEIIESHHNLDDSYVFTNAITEIITKENAHADWHKLQNDSATSYLVDNTFVKQDRDSIATVNAFSFGGSLVRNNIVVTHNGENVSSFLNGITIIGGKQTVDNHTLIRHRYPHCTSYQNFKGVYGDQSHGVFYGLVDVDRLAQKTDAYQQNNNVLLDPGAKVDSKPQLLIYADDVKCSHGCTVGQLDDTAMFYLQARGIPEREAKALLLYAFTHNAMENIDIEPLKLKVSKLLAEKLKVDMEF